MNSMIIRWIRASISPRIRSTVTSTSDAHKLWEDLLQRYSIGNAVCAHRIRAELAACKQDGMKVMNYFGKLSTRWEELLTYKPLPKCMCSAMTKIVKDHEEERVHQFLMGLDEVRFGNVVTNIISMEPLPDLNSVYQRVVREERRFSSSRPQAKQEVIGFAAKTEESHMQVASGFNTTTNNISLSSIVCSHCRGNGHEKRECWQIFWSGGLRRIKILKENEETEVEPVRTEEEVVAEVLLSSIGRTMHKHHKRHFPTSRLNNGLLLLSYWNNRKPL